MVWNIVWKLVFERVLVLLYEFGTLERMTVDIAPIVWMCYNRNFCYKLMV